MIRNGQIKVTKATGRANDLYGFIKAVHLVIVFPWSYNMYYCDPRSDYY